MSSAKAQERTAGTYPADRRWPWPTENDYPDPYPMLTDNGQDVVPCVGALRGRCCGDRHDAVCSEPVQYVVRWDCGEWDEECLRCERHVAADRSKGDWLRSVRTFFAPAPA